MAARLKKAALSAKKYIRKRLRRKRSQILQKNCCLITILSQTNTLRGKLIIKNIESITVEHKPQTGTLKKTYDDGDILDLEIKPGKI